MSAARKRKQPKVRLDRKKVLVFAALVISLCAALLCITALFGPLPDDGPQSPAVEADAAPAGQSSGAREETLPPPPAAEDAALAPVQQAPAGKTAGAAAHVQEIPPAVDGAALLFVIDDAGQSTGRLSRYTSLPFPLAVAVLPKLAHSAECAAIVRSAGKEVLLHQPMQALNAAVNPGPGAITPDMSVQEIQALVRENIAELGGVSGLNNHEGSRITEDVLRIGAVLDAAAECGVYFLDSRTTANTRAPEAAAARGMDILARDVFLDNDVDRDGMLGQLHRALAIANKKGTVIIIGHVDKSAEILPELLADLYPQLERAGYRFLTPSMLLQEQVSSGR